MDIEFELAKYNVSRETKDRLVAFVSVLQEWNSKINLVSKNSMAEVWQRHVLDSLQLINFLPADIKHLVDIGSGAGFPGVILAIALMEKQPKAKVTLVESIGKKTVYLKDVCSRIGLVNTVVENQRIENMSFGAIDVITARAVAALEVLCGYCAPISGKKTKMLFLKGKSYADEMAVSQQKWKYDYHIHENMYSTDGVILELSNLRKVK